MRNIVRRNAHMTRRRPVAMLEPPLHRYLISLAILAVGDALNVAAIVTPFVNECNVQRLLWVLAIVFPFIVAAMTPALWLRRLAQRNRAGLAQRVIRLNRILLAAARTTYVI